MKHHFEERRKVSTMCQEMNIPWITTVDNKGIIHHSFEVGVTIVFFQEANRKGEKIISILESPALRRGTRQPLLLTETYIPRRD